MCFHVTCTLKFIMISSIIAEALFCPSFQVHFKAIMPVAGIKLIFAKLSACLCGNGTRLVPCKHA